SETGSNAAELKEMALARIRQLSCHEVGHTLGMGHNYAASVNDRASVMDYPSMLIKLDAQGKIDLSDAYATGIGEWDKVSIAYGYQDFPDGVDEEKQLRAILDTAFSGGLVFLAGQDAGVSSAHPLAATWDNGKNPVDELDRVLKVRRKALDTFTERRIPFHTPLSLLEDPLVPVYLYHRYQAEAAASVLGGMDYSHKLRGDVQGLPQIISGSEQRRALKSLIRTLHPMELAIPDNILDLIPPRAPGYRGGEVFPGFTGSTFDPLGAAETAADLTVGLILHPERAARLVDFHSRQPDTPALAEVIDVLVKNSWQVTHPDSYFSEIQRTVNDVVLKHLMGLAVEEGTSSQVRAVANLKLEELKKWLDTHFDGEKDPGQKAHFHYGISLIEQFQQNPQQFKLVRPLSAPAGAPIGTLRR
ncbi:zinc-dependent metalloprotease, partial [Acidobacteriota bacterium]